MKKTFLVFAVILTTLSLNSQMFQKITNQPLVMITDMVPAVHGVTIIMTANLTLL